MNAVLIIAHTPLAHALRQGVLHMFPDAAEAVTAVDVHPTVPPEESLAVAQAALRQLNNASVLVLTDVFGATPCNVAQRLVSKVEASRADGADMRLVAGANLPMLMRAVTYRAEPLEVMLQRALAGGAQGVMQVAVAVPQNQPNRAPNDQERYHHQQ